MKKYLATIVIVVLLSLWLVFQGTVYLHVIDRFALPEFLKLVIKGIMATLVIVLLIILIQRLREVKEDNEDDISQY